MLHGETGHPFRAATGSSVEGSSGRYRKYRQAGSKGSALGGARAEPLPYFLPRFPGPETDMRSSPPDLPSPSMAATSWKNSRAPRCAETPGIAPRWSILRFRYGDEL